MNENYNMLRLDTVNSTNAYARLHAVNLETPSVIITDKQTAGRGRYDRVWQAADGNVMMSLLIDADKHVEQLGQLSFVASLALASAIGDDSVSVKWPNDVLYDGKKLAGILLETVQTANDVSHVIIGVGVNVTSFPDDVAFAATSLVAQGDNTSRDELITRFLQEFDIYYKQWLTDFEPIRLAWLKKCAHVGENIVVKTATDQKEGVFVGLGADGELLLQVSGGKQEVLNVGDVFFKDNC